MPSVSKKSPVPLPLDVPAAPAGSAPDVPADFQVLTQPQVRQLRKPTADQSKNAAAVAGEIKTAVAYTNDFGQKAIPQDALHTQMTTAAAWSTEAARAQRWAAYASNMASLSWNRVLGSLDTFAKDFDTAMHHDATIAERYPSLTAFRGARSAASKRAAATRREQKAAKNGAPKPTG
ncbi:MAG: hypothetical protein QM820_20265 [Minicystis sp.]